MQLSMTRELGIRSPELSGTSRSKNQVRTPRLPHLAEPQERDGAAVVATGALRCARPEAAARRGDTIAPVPVGGHA
jgi:hypothetical protein